MSYRIIIPPSVQKRIKSIVEELRIPFDISEDVFSKIRELGEKPSLGKMANRGIFRGFMNYTFRVNRLPLSFQFTVSYKFSDNESDIYITDFEYTHGDPPKKMPR